MVLYLHLLRCFWLLILLLLPTTLAASTPYQPRDHYLIACENPTSSQLPSLDGATWRSEDHYLTSATITTTIVPTTAAAQPYTSARIFWAPLTYSFPLSSPGPKLLRLYFFTDTKYNNTDPKQFFLSLDSNGFNLLHNFSPYLAVANAEAHENTNAPVSERQLVREFYVTVEKANKPLNLNLIFSPKEPSSSDSVNNSALSYGFINGIEIISVPDGLYVPVRPTEQSVNIPHLAGGPADYESNFNFSASIAMETMIRVNVGGSDVQPSNDSGLRRTWYKDSNFIVDFWGSTSYNYSLDINYTIPTPSFTAPHAVYQTMRITGINSTEHQLRLSRLTWMFDVDVGFDYLVRLHFCEILSQVNQTGLLLFDIYINNQMVCREFDPIQLAGSPGTAAHLDFFAYVDDNGGGGGANNSKGSRVHLPVALQPRDNTLYVDAFLNGLEILKLNNSNGSLAAPNPYVLIPPPEAPSDEIDPLKRHNLVPIIIGATLGFILLSLVAFVFFFIYFRKEKEEASALIPSSKDSTKPKWAPLNMDESHSSTATTSSSVALALPSDLCRRFSLTQLRIATHDFDDSAIIGSGGFGKVYKGYISGEANPVAIKRLNSESTQGFQEFRTEIEMLSRLRHVHLVSLIGYCQDHGEMMLVYEYMSRGTLRDHLLYKSNNRTENDTSLSWKQRLMICIGSARGLHYLHSGAKQPIIHRDVKSTNILLDDKWTAKVSDFGLSKVGPTSDTGVGYVSTAVKGSVGYLDPEYYRLRQLTEKSDVYSFGVVLFEVLCARHAINTNLPKDQVNLALWARKHCKKGTLGSIVDPNLEGQIASESLRKFGEIAEMCVKDQGSERPSMGDVVWGLEFVLQLQLTADQKITGGINGGDLGVATEDKVATDPEKNQSTSSSSISGSGTVSWSSSIPGATSNSGTGVIDLSMRSSSVFSEIVHPEGR